MPVCLCACVPLLGRVWWAGWMVGWLAGLVGLVLPRPVCPSQSVRLPTYRAATCNLQSAIWLPLLLHPCGVVIAGRSLIFFSLSPSQGQGR